MERNYALLEQERKEISIPFPEVHPYDTGIDYEDISDIQYKKGQNQPAWDRIAVVDRYLTASKLFVGHCLMQGGANYYIIDHPSLASKNQITPEQCYALKGDKLVLERLAQKTLGDPDAYTDVTFCDIISEIQQEAEIEGALKEKKKNEILQMLVLNPKLAILDETDSGLDVDAIKTVSRGISMYKNDSNAVLIITHNNKILENLHIDYVHVLVDGKIVNTGDASLADEIEKEGYAKYKKVEE